LSRRQVGSTLTGKPERPAGNEGHASAVLVHQNDSSVFLDGDDLKIERNIYIITFHANIQSNRKYNTYKLLNKNET